MFIRQTKTSNAASGEAYTTFRLVASERIGGKVRQQTLLNLGSSFSLAREHWPELCNRIEQILSGQLSLMPATAEIEPLAQRYAARLSGQQVGHHQRDRLSGGGCQLAGVAPAPVDRGRAGGPGGPGMA